MNQSTKRASLSVLLAMMGLFLLTGATAMGAPVVDWDDDGVADADEVFQGTDEYYPMESAKYAPRALDLSAIQATGVAIPVTAGILRNDAPSTVEFWLLPVTGADDTVDSIFADGVSGSIYNYSNGELDIQLAKSGDRAKFVVVQNGTAIGETADFKVGHKAAPQYDDWQHVALTTDGDGNYSLYLNDMSNAAASWFNPEAATAGNGAVIGKGFAHAYLDEFRFFTSERTEAQLLKNSATMCTKDEDPDLAIYYRFDDGGATVEDFAHIPDFKALAAANTDDAAPAVAAAFQYRLAMPSFADANCDGHADWVTSQACAMDDTLEYADGDGDGFVHDTAENLFDNIQDYAIVRNPEANYLETSAVQGSDLYFANGAFIAAYDRATSIYIKAGPSEILATAPMGNDIPVNKRVLAKAFAAGEEIYWDGVDDDSDGVIDDCAVALPIGRNPSESGVVDSDEDGLPDSWEIRHFGDLAVSDGTGDYDGDGVSDAYEYKMGLNPTTKVSAPRSFYATLTDGTYANVRQTEDGSFLLADGSAAATVQDADKVAAMTDGEIDFDGDSIANYDELHKFGTEPMLKDTDGDGLDDNIELFVTHSDPKNPDDPASAGLRVLDLVLASHDVTVMNPKTGALDFTYTQAARTAPHALFYDQEISESYVKNAAGDYTYTVVSIINGEKNTETSVVTATEMRAAVDNNGFVQDGENFTRTIRNFSGIDDPQHIAIDLWFNLAVDSGSTGTLIQKQAEQADGFKFFQDWRLWLNNGKLTFTYNTVGNDLASPGNKVENAVYSKATFAPGDGWTHVVVAINQTADSGSNYTYDLTFASQKAAEEIMTQEKAEKMIGLLRPAAGADPTTSSLRGPIVIGDDAAATARLSMTVDQISIWKFDSNTTLPVATETRFGDNAVAGNAGAELLFFADCDQENGLAFWSKGVKLESRGVLAEEALTVLDVEAGTADDDTDGDGIADAWEMYWFGNLTTADDKSDYDKDGVTDLQEYQMGYCPTNKISTPRSFWTMVAGEYIQVTQNSDGTVFVYGTTTDVTADVEDLSDLLALEDGDVDYDGDWLANAAENIDYGTDPLNADSDGDDLNDWEEIMNGTDPLSGSEPWYNRALDLVVQAHDVTAIHYDEATEKVVETTETLAARTAPYAEVPAFDGMVKDLANWSAELWFNLADDSALDGALIQKTSVKANAKGDFWFGLKNGKLTLTIKDKLVKAAGGQKSFVLDELTIEKNVWTHASFSVKKTAGNKYQVEISAFADGKEYSYLAESVTGTVNTASQAGSLVIGDLPAAATRLSVQIDELRIWNRVVTAEEFRLNRDIFLSAETANLAAYFQFNHTTANREGVSAITYTTRSDLAASVKSTQQSYNDALERYRSATAAVGEGKTATEEQKKEIEYAQSNLNQWRQRLAEVTEAYEDEMNGDGLVVKLLEEARLSITVSEEYQDGDSDGDGIADWWEYNYFGDLDTANSTSDNDGDKLSDYYEYLLRGEGADPKDPYSLAGDGKTPDGDMDSDDDGLTNAEEMTYSTDPLDVDTDDDGVSDKIEVALFASPLHPMSVVVTKADGKPLTGKTWAEIVNTDMTLYRATNGPARSLDLGKLDARIDLPNPDRFAVGTRQEDYEVTINGDFTYELWVKVETGAESGILFETRATNGWGWRFMLENGVPKGEIFTKTNEVIAVVGGEGATPALEPGSWTYLALNWNSEAKTLYIFRDKIALIGSLPVNYNIDFGDASEYAFIENASGISVDEIRFWGETRQADQIEYWSERVVPSPLNAAISYELLSDGKGGTYEERWMRRKYELRANYRFDDGGKTVEDFAHFREDGYALALNPDAIFDVADGAKVLNGVDDIDGDGIPEWWMNAWSLNTFPNGAENLPFLDWYQTPGHQPSFFSSYGENTYRSDWTGMLIWDGDTIKGIQGYFWGVGYTALGGRGEYTTTWMPSNGIIPLTVNNQDGTIATVGGRPDGAYIEDNRQLNVDMAYIAMHKYITLANQPAEAYLSFDEMLGGHVTGVIINLKRVEDYGPKTNIAQYLRPGRNQIAVNWSRAEYAKQKYKVKKGDKEVEYERSLFGGSLDIGMTVDNNLVIAKGHDYRYDPRAVWYYRATTKDYSMASMKASFGSVGADNAGFALTDITGSTISPYGLNYGAVLDKDNDGLDISSEYLIGSNPLSKDSDNNGIFDGKEDYDVDGIVNDIEINSLFTDPLISDTDNDGVTDSAERASASNPIDWNSPVNYFYLKTDGSADGYLQMPLQSRFALSTFTIEAMVKAVDPAQGGIIVQRVVGTVDPAKPLVNYELGLTKDGKPYMSFSDKFGDKSSRTLTAANPIQADTWTHMAMCFDENTNLMTLYVDGVEVANGMAASQPIVSGPALVSTCAGIGFEGGIDELRFWKDIRTAAEIQNCMDKTLVGDEDNLAAYYRFDDVDLRKRAMIADYTDAELRADGSLYPTYLYCADSSVACAADWRNDWLNVALLKGTATVTEDAEHSNSFQVGIYAYSNGTEEGDEDPGFAYLAPAGSSDMTNDILQAVILSYPASAATGNVTYKYFWLKTDAVGYTTDDLTYSSDALYEVATGNALGNKILLGVGTELNLGDIDGVAAGDHIQLVVAAVNSDGVTSVLSTSVAIELKEADADHSIPKALTLVSPLEDQADLAAGTALQVQARNDNDFDGIAHISWYRNMVLTKTSATDIAAGATATLTMSDTTKVVKGDVWSFKIWFERTGSTARSKAIPPAPNAVDPTDEWIFMQIGTGFDEEITSSGKPVYGAPTIPTKVTVTPIDPDPQSILTANASGSQCAYPFNYYYQWYYKGIASTNYVLASGQNLPYWHPAVTGIADDMGITEDGFSTYVLDPGDQIYCAVYAMNIYGEKSRSKVSAVVTINVDTASGSSYEPNNDWRHARPIYAKTTWMDNSDPRIQLHNFDAKDDQDWVKFIVPEGTDNRKMLVSFETNSGTMFKHGDRKDNTGRPATGLTLYRWNSKKDTVEEVYRTLGFVANDNTGDSTRFARFVNMKLDPGVYYIQVWPQDHNPSDVGASYYMHLYMERELWDGTAIVWNTADADDEGVVPSAVELQPGTPGASDDLVVTLHNYAYDPEDNKITTYRYLWYRNGIVVPLNGVSSIESYATSRYILEQAKLGANTIKADMTSEGDTWYCVVYPYSETYGFGEPMTTNTVSIGASCWNMELSTRKTFKSGAEVVSGDEVVTLGWEQFATFGFDPTFDDQAPSLSTPSSTGVGIRQALPLGAIYSMGFSNSAPYLTKDVRPYGNTSSWFIIAELGDPKSDTITDFALTWSETALPASTASGITITQMKKRVDGYFEAILGTTVSVKPGEAGEVALAGDQLANLQQDANGQKYAIFRVTIGAPDSMQTITLKPGWNLVALPLTPLNGDVNDIFSVNGSRLYSGSVWQYEGGRYVAAKNVVATRGYWLYAKTSAVVNVYGTAESDVISLAEGWNIIGPVYDIDDFDAMYKRDYPKAYEKIAKNADGGLELYKFDPQTGGYLLAVEGGKYVLKVGNGYWIKATEAAELPVIVPSNEK